MMAFSGRRSRRRVVLAEQLVHQSIGELVEVVQSIAQVGIGGAQHARARIRLYALDRRFCRQSGRHRLFQAVHPAAIVSEHAIGFENVAMLAAIGDFAALEQHVEIRSQGLDRGFQSLELLRHIVGNEVRDHHARLVQHHVSQGDAFAKRRPGEMEGAADGGLEPRLGDGRKLARRDHLGEHHRGRLQRFLFLLGVSAACPILHHQHAERVAGAQHRHAEEGTVNLFPGLGPV